MKNRIKELAKEKGIGTISALATLSNVTQATLSNIVNEKQKPSFEVLEKIATALNVEVWELFTESTAKGDLYGFVEYKNTVYKIDSKEALKSLLDEVEKEGE